jgi:hypothetical protein
MGSEDQFRHYFPLMRRIIILVAVLTAIPVIMWTITVFVRGYFGPPKIAGPRPLATATIEAPVSPAASQDANGPAVVEARATVADARTIPPAVKWPSPGDRQGSNDAGPPSSAPSAAVMAPAGSAGADQRAQAPGAQTTGPQTMPAQTMATAPAMPAGAAMQTGTNDTSGALAAQDSADADQQAADAGLPAAQPIAGPVPLPRHRPRSFAMLTSAVPMPRPRPEAAGAAGSEGSATPLGWLQKIFTPQQQ